MDRIDFLGFTFLTRDISRLDRYSTRQKKEGRDAARGAVITFCGAWFFPLFAVVLDKAGVSTLSCVNFANIM